MRGQGSVAVDGAAGILASHGGLTSDSSRAVGVLTPGSAVWAGTWGLHDSRIGERYPHVQPEVDADEKEGQDDWPRPPGVEIIVDL